MKMVTKKNVFEIYDFMSSFQTDIFDDLVCFVGANFQLRELKSEGIFNKYPTWYEDAHIFATIVTQQ